MWNLKLQGRKVLESFSSDLSDKFDESNLIIMHGHGVRNVLQCGQSGNSRDLHGKVLMTGSCFSASPRKSDLPEMRDAPGGFTVEKRDAFILKAVDQGALVAFGHQRLSSGFPHLYPVLESWLQGDTVGEGYQQLLNALIDFKGFRAGDFVVRQPSKKPPQNVLLMWSLETLLCSRSSDHEPLLCSYRRYKVIGTVLQMCGDSQWSRSS